MVLSCGNRLHVSPNIDVPWKLAVDTVQSWFCFPLMEYPNTASLDNLYTFVFQRPGVSQKSVPFTWTTYKPQPF
jgi:hypothetical protein